MARGAESKALATDIILKSFPGSFVYEKEIRLPYTENGEDIQLKCVLTCAKVNVEKDGENAIPGEDSKGEQSFATVEQEDKPKATVTQEEKDNIRNLMNALGL